MEEEGKEVKEEMWTAPFLFGGTSPVTSGPPVGPLNGPHYLPVLLLWG